MSKKNVRVGIIGAGWWAANTHVPALRAVEGVEIVACCRRQPDRLKEFADKIGVPQTYLDHEEMLDMAKLDAVIVCSPHARHYEHVKSALQRGLPVLTDKPLSIRSSEAEELVALAELKGALLAVFFGHAYDSVHRYIAKQIKNGCIGRLAHFSANYYANPDMLGFFGNSEFQENPAEFPILPTPFRADPILGGGGYLQDVGNHVLSAMLIGTGLKVEEVSAVMDQTEIDLRASVCLKFIGGGLGTATVAGDLRPEAMRYFGTGHFSVVGDRAGFWKFSGDDRLWHQDWSDSPQPVPPSELPAHTNPDANFIAAIRGEEALIAPGSAAIDCVRVIEAAYLSARTGRKVILK